MTRGWRQYDAHLAVLPIRGSALMEFRSNTSSRCTHRRSGRASFPRARSDPHHRLRSTLLGSLVFAELPDTMAFLGIAAAIRRGTCRGPFDLPARIRQRRESHIFQTNPVCDGPIGPEGPEIGSDSGGDVKSLAARLHYATTPLPEPPPVRTARRPRGRWAIAEGVCARWRTGGLVLCYATSRARGAQRNAVSSRPVVFDEAALEPLGLRTPDRREPR
jgi:hypothetical protein